MACRPVEATVAAIAFTSGLSLAVRLLFPRAFLRRGPERRKVDVRARVTWRPRTETSLLARGRLSDVKAQESGTLSALATVRTRLGRRGGGGRA